MSEGVIVEVRVPERVGEGEGVGVRVERGVGSMLEVTDGDEYKERLAV